MPLLNPYLRAFFRSALPAQCVPVEDYILLVPTTEVLLNTRDRESGSLYADLAGVDEFMASHVLRVPNSAAGMQQSVGGRESRGKARQFTTFNGRTVVVKDTWVYSNKGFKSLNQAQLLNDTLYYPDVLEPQQWLIYFISKPLMGSMELVSTIPPLFRDRTKSDQPPSSSGGTVKKKEIRSFNELLMLFPMIARQMTPGLEKLFHTFEISFEKYKPLPLPPPSPSARSVSSSRSSIRSIRSVHSSVNGDIYQQAAEESEIRRSLEIAINSAVELFQRVDQSQLDLLATTTELTGPAVDRLIERYVAEQLHDSALFPRLCATCAIEDEELEQKIIDMENVDLSQVGIPSLELQEQKPLIRRIIRGVASFEKISTARSPQAMVEHLLETARTLTQADDDIYSAAASSNPEKSTVVTMNADMLVSLLLVVVIRAKVPNLHASLTYMRSFSFVEDVEQGETGYILSTLEAVLFHIAQDHSLCKASRINEKLWMAVRDGDIDSVKKYLHLNSDDQRSFESTTTDEDATNGESPQHKTSGESENILPILGIPSINSHASTPSPQPNGMNGSARPTAKEINGKHRRSSTSSRPRSKDGQINGVVHIVDTDPDEIPRQESSPPEKAEGHEEKSLTEEEIEANKVDGESLTKEGPPAQDLFTSPSSPTTGISMLRVEEIRDVDSDSLSLMRVPSTQKLTSAHTSPNPRSGVARFEVDVRPASSKFRSKSAISLTTAVSDASRKSSTTSLSRTSTTQSQTTDATSVGKLSKTRNAQGESILMMAIQDRKSDILQFLLETQLFDIRFVLDDTDNDGTTLLSAAIQVEDMESVEVVLKELFRLSEAEIRRYLEKPDSAGRTAAHYFFSTPELINRLGQWLPWRSRDRNGQTPLFALCRSYDHQRYREMVGMAMKRAQNAQGDGWRLHLDQHVDSKGNTLLHIVADPVVLKSLLKCDVDVNAVNEKGFTALMVASKYGRIETVRTLFGDPRVDLLAKELRGLTAVELAKDDEVRNRIDDLVLFQHTPNSDGRVTAIVRSFFVEDASVRVVLKSGAPAVDDPSSFTVVTCRRSLTDFEFLSNQLRFENPASWLPALPGARSPYQIPSKPSRSVLRDIQLRLDSFLNTLLSHPTFSTHELLWEFFLVPEIQQDLMVTRSRKKAEARIDRIREEFTPVSDVREVEMFVSYAKDNVRSIGYKLQSVTRRVTAVRQTLADLVDAFRLTQRHLYGFHFLQNTPQMAAFAKLADCLVLNDSHPYTTFLESLRDTNASIVGITTALERPRQIILEIQDKQKQIEKHIIALRRSDRWPMALLEDTRSRIHQEAKEKVRLAEEERLELASELRWTQSVAAIELSAWQERRREVVKGSVRELAKRMVVVERERLRGMERALRIVKSDPPRGSELGT